LPSLVRTLAHVSFASIAGRTRSSTKPPNVSSAHPVSLLSTTCWITTTVILSPP
jgi:hypothetical protein